MKARKNTIFQLIAMTLLAVWMSTSIGYSQFLEYGVQYEDHIEKANIIQGANITVVDPGANDPTQVSGHLAYAVPNRTTFVRLVYGRGDRKDLAGTSWSYTVHYDLKDLETGEIEQGTLEINRNDNGGIHEAIEKYEDFSKNAELQVTYTSSTGDITDIEDISLELIMGVERYNYFDDTQIPQFLVGQSPIDHEAQCKWSELDGAVAYDLEWVYVDSEMPVSSLPATDEELFKDAARIRLHQTHYNLDIIYPSGTLYFRVRGVGRYIEDVDGDYSYWKPGEWTTRAPQTTSLAFESFENNRNWQYAIEFGEDGKSKQSISYFDEGLKPRQSQTNLSTDDVTVVGERFYDVEGRVTLSVIPAPLDNEADIGHPTNTLFYHSMGSNARLNLNSTGTSYNRANYDKTNHAEPLKNTSGASKYFSVNNESETIQKDYIPNANGYIFSQTKYRRDGTDRPIEQSGVGEQFQLGGDHSTEYFYGGVGQMELDRLFVHNVGDASHYRKNVTKDANGQMIVSYVSMAGQTIATALTGQTPNNVQDITGGSVPIYRNLNSHNFIDENNWMSITSDEIVNTEPNNQYDFAYDITGVLYGYMEDDQEICVDCEYELTLTLLDPQGQPMSIDLLPYTFPIKIEPNSTLNQGNCNNDSYAMSQAVVLDADRNPVALTAKGIEFSAVLPEIGTYRIVKELKLIIPPIPSIIQDITLQGIQPSLTALEQYYESIIDPYGCTYTCNQYCEAYVKNVLGYDENHANFDIEVANCRESQCGAMIESALDVSIDGMCGSWLNAMKAQVSPEGVFYLQGDTYSWNGIANLEFSGIDANGQPFSGVKWDDDSPFDASVEFKVHLFDEDYWQEEWADVLVQAHREYCHYQSCNDPVMRAANKFLAELSMTTNIADAEQFIQDELGTSSTITLVNSNGHILWNDIVSADPYFGPNHAFGGTSGRLASYQVAGMSNNNTGVNAYIDYWEQNNSPNTALTDEQRWNMFLGVYFAERREQIEDDNNCQYFTDSDAIVPELDNIYDVTGTYEDLLNQATNEMSSFTGGICELNVEGWIAEITSGCTLISSTDLELIRQHLLAYCTGNSSSNPVGYLLLEDILNDPNLLDVQTIINGPCGSSSSTPFSLSDIATATNDVYQPVLDDNDNCITTDVFVIEPCLTTIMASINDQLPALTSSTSSSQNMAAGLCYGSGNVTATGDISVGTFTCEDGSNNTLGLDFKFYTSAQVLVENWTIEKITSITVQDIALPAVGSFIYGKIAVNLEIKAAAAGGVSGTTVAGYLYVNGDPPCNFYTTNTTCQYAPIELNIADLSNSCEDMALEQAHLLAQIEYDRQWDILVTNYIQERYRCFESLQEDFTVTYYLNEKHYTLYYYDQTGSLIMTVPPEGVQPLPSSYFDPNTGELSTSVTDFPHTLETHYFYNSWGQMIKKTTPDESKINTTTNTVERIPTHFFYDFLGRLRLSQNAKQNDESDGSTNAGDFIYSYVKHDGLGRPIEAGQLHDYEYDITDANDFDQIFTDVNERAFPESTYTFSEAIYTTYDEGDGTIIQNNLRGRVAKIWNDHIITRYSYGVHGLAETVSYEIPDLGIKRIEYDYDLLTGEVSKVRYQEGEADQFYHYYEYDAEKRLTHAYTSDDGLIYDLEARYFYSLHGPLTRVELGHDKVQAWDIYSTLRGRIKGVNAPNDILGDYDPGHDGASGDNQYIGVDEFAYQLGYFEGDYNPIGKITSTAHMIDDTQEWNHLGTNILSFNSSERGLYNGNIAYMLTDIKEIGRTGGQAMNAMAYQYDQLHRIKQARSAKRTGNGYSFENNYDANYSFDGNGNLTQLKRWYDQKLIDDIQYDYYQSNSQLQHNKLLSIADNATQGNVYGDIITKDAAVDGIKSHRYKYDALGNLVAESQMYNENGSIVTGYTNMNWTLTGKIQSVLYTDSRDHTTRDRLNFGYDVADNRLFKEVGDSYTANNGEKFIYIRDGSGTPLAVYKQQVESGHAGGEYRMTYLLEHSIYGNKRLGIADYGQSRLVHVHQKVGSTYQEVSSPSLSNGLELYTTNEYNRERGYKRYELTNHLGNVLTVVSDMTNGHNNGGEADYYLANVISASDYYPYGWVMPGRKISNTSYRYGFNGQETDSEWRGGQAVSFRFRIQDPRLGRFLSVDPLAPDYPWYSPYQFAGNTTIRAIDVEGGEPMNMEDIVKVIEPYAPKIGKGTIIRIKPYEKLGEEPKTFYVEISEGNIHTEVTDVYSTLDLGYPLMQIKEEVLSDFQVVDEFSANWLAWARTNESEKAYQDYLLNSNIIIQSGNILYDGMVTAYDAAMGVYSLTQGEYVQAGMYFSSVCLLGITGKQLRDLLTVSPNLTKSINNIQGIDGRTLNSAEFESFFKNGDFVGFSGVYDIKTGSYIMFPSVHKAKAHEFGLRGGEFVATQTGHRAAQIELNKVLAQNEGFNILQTGTRKNAGYARNQELARFHKSIKGTQRQVGFTLTYKNGVYKMKYSSLGVNGNSGVGGQNWGGKANKGRNNIPLEIRETITSRVNADLNINSTTQTVYK